MSGALTEEQRQRIEANRQRALQRKVQRQQQLQLQNYHAVAGCSNVFDYDEARPRSSDESAPTFDYSNVPFNNNSAARESFGDSGIDWDEAIAMDTHSKNQSKNVACNQNKRKLDVTESSNTPDQSSHVSNGKEPIAENRFEFNDINSNSTGAKLSLTEDQRTRMETNRLKALEKKKRAATNSAEIHINVKHPDQSNHDSSASLEFNCTENSTLIENNSYISDNQKARMEKNRLKALEKKHKAVNSSYDSSFTDEPKVLTEQKRLLVLQKKQSLSTTPILFTDEQKSTTVGKGGTAFNPVGQLLTEVITSNTKSKPVHVITEEQRILIETKRLAALQKKQSRLIAVESSFVAQSNNDSPKKHECSAMSHAGTEQNGKEVDVQPLILSSITSSKICGQSATIQPPDSRTENVQEAQSMLSSIQMSSLTDEQRALIEQKRLLALQKKQALRSTSGKNHGSDQEQQSSVSQTVGGVSSLKVVPPQNDSKKADQPARATAQRNASDTVIEKSKNIESPPFPKKETPIESGLPTLPPDIQYESSRCLPVEDEHSDTLIENADMNKPLLNGWSLFEHQKEGVSRALRMRRLILAFDMGLGKTIIGCVWSKAFIRTIPDIKVFVISPVSLIEDWSRTAKDATGLNPGRRTKTKKSRAKKKSSTDEVDEETSTNQNMYIFSWSSVADCKSILIDKPSKYVVICDEAHNMQSMTSKRTVDALKLILGKKCQGCLLLSGTPMKNGKPSNLFPLLRAVKHPFGDDQKRYEFFFCNAQYRRMNGKEVWDASGSSNLNELHAHTSSYIFRKTKDECMSDELHPKKREYMKVPVSSRQELRYNQALKELANAFNAMQYAKGEIGYDPNEHNILEPFNKLRQASSFAKIDAAVSLANDLVKEEGSIVVFTSFVSVAKEVKQKLEDRDWAGQLLTGEVVAHKRQQMVDEFQDGVTPVFVCTYGAGGVGLTLTAACTVILVDRPWTPGDVNQAEDRVRRIGQKRPVRSIWLRAFPIDEQIDSLIDHKEINSCTAVDGMAGSGHNKAAPKISIAELVKTALNGIE